MGVSSEPTWQRPADLHSELPREVLGPSQTGSPHYGLIPLHRQSGMKMLRARCLQYLAVNDPVSVVAMQ